MLSQKNDDDSIFKNVIKQTSLELSAHCCCASGLYFPDVSCQLTSFKSFLLDILLMKFQFFTRVVPFLFVGTAVENIMFGLFVVSGIGNKLEKG